MSLRKSLYNVLSVKQVLPNGEKIVYEESDKLYWDDSDYSVSTSAYLAIVLLSKNCGFHL